MDPFPPPNEVEQLSVSRETESATYQSHDVRRPLAPYPRATYTLCYISDQPRNTADTSSDQVSPSTDVTTATRT